MGWDYALVHIKFTIPPCIALTLLYRPLLSGIDLYKTLFLVIIAVVSTIPWDSYLINAKIWTYPEDAVLGYTFFDIPAEELFFFVIQTYGVCLFYICFTKPAFYPVFLPLTHSLPAKKFVGRTVQLMLLIAIFCSYFLVQNGGQGTYLGLIFIWALPFVLLLWSLSYPFLLGLPSIYIWVPIAVPTLYLWLVDTLSLKRGTWAISSGTKLEVNLWDGLDIEEAVFFATVNVLIVFGLLTFDYAITINETFSDRYPKLPRYLSPWLAVQIILAPFDISTDERIRGLKQAIARLEKKSRSFFLASAAFSGRLRIDLIALYSYCRVADDLIDGASTADDAAQWIAHLREFLDKCYSPLNVDGKVVREHVEKHFPSSVQLSLLQLPHDRLFSDPLYDLLEGFKIDLKFFSASNSHKNIPWPIRVKQDLVQYSEYVAGTVGELCVGLLLVYYPEAVETQRTKNSLRSQAVKMGTALQIINIARDIQADSEIGRVYIPSEWLEEYDMSPLDIVSDPTRPEILELRTRLLNEAFQAYETALPALAELPKSLQGPMRMAVESYVEIGRTLREQRYQVIKRGKATVPRWRRLWVAWKALNNL